MPAVDEHSYSSICRVFTVIRIEQLKQIIQEGFNSIPETLVFSTNPMIVAALYQADGGSNFPPILSEGSSIQYLGERNELHPNTEQLVKEDDMVLLKQAKQMKPLLLLR